MASSIEQLPIVNSLKDLLNPEILVENTYLFATLSIFLAMYGPRLHMKLPHSLKSLFDNPVFRGSVLFLIAYMAHRDFVGALVITIIFLITLNLLHTTEVLENVTSILSNEGFQVNGPPVANCNSYKSSDPMKLGTKFYPLHDGQDSLDIRGGNQTLNEYSAGDIRLDN
jgi:hypothetical protein